MSHENQTHHKSQQNKPPGCGCVGCFFSALGMLLLLLLMGVGGVIFCCYYAVYLEPNWVRVQKIVIKQPELAKALSGMKIVQLSDIHTIDRVRELENRMVEVTNALEPDIILITGDFITKKEGFKPCMEVISRLKAKIGIWGILGNCDFSVGNYQWKQEGKNAGMTMLIDEKVRINLGDDKRLWLLGVDNGHGSVSPYLKRLMRGIKKDDAVILLDHEPGEIEESSLFDIDLVLSGDTHGGQCGVRWVRQFYGWKNKYLAGLYKVRDTYLYVNRGIGWHHKPVRFLCWPEVTMMTFVTDGSSTRVKEPEAEECEPTELHKFISDIWHKIDTSRISETIRREDMKE
ncbi:metallophosphoesterase [Candidatus Desantisbacteria bacterium]|nr:metallophosphoesterase [Candidatus Desantisbacteria bacterium]